MHANHACGNGMLLLGHLCTLCLLQKSLLYGGTTTYSVTSDFPDPSPATTFMSPAHSYMYFQNNQCMRSDQSTCLKEDDKFYQVGRRVCPWVVQYAGWYVMHLCCFSALACSWWKLCPAGQLPLGRSRG
jgi:hypothetical protein